MGSFLKFAALFNTFPTMCHTVTRAHVFDPRVLKNPVVKKKISVISDAKHTPIQLSNLKKIDKV